MTRRLSRTVSFFSATLACCLSASAFAIPDYDACDGVYLMPGATSTDATIEQAWFERASGKHWTNYCEDEYLMPGHLEGSCSDARDSMADAIDWAWYIRDSMIMDCVFVPLLCAAPVNFDDETLLDIETGLLMGDDISEPVAVMVENLRGTSAYPTHDSTGRQAYDIGDWMEEANEDLLYFCD